MEIKISKFDLEMLRGIWELGYRQDQPEWASWNGPYFEDYIKYDSFEDFQESDIGGFLLKDNCRCILANGRPVGMLSRNWEDRKTLWLEIGIVIYDEKSWGSGLGAQAMTQWIEETFNDFPEIQHIGLTTWSGNIRMMKLAEKIGFKKEAQIRKVRYWQGIFYDSVKYGVLREEWENLNQL